MKKSEQIHFRISPETKTRLDTYCKQHQMTVSSFINDAINEKIYHDSFECQTEQMMFLNRLYNANNISSYANPTINRLIEEVCTYYAKYTH